MPIGYREIGKEILDKLDIDPTRLGEMFSQLSQKVRECLEREAWNEVHTQCELAHELCNGMQGAGELREWSNAIDLAQAEGIFHAYEGISYLYQVDEKAEEPQESAELAKAIHCLQKSQQSFCFEYHDRWNEHVICLSLEKLYGSQDKLKEALLASQRSSCIERTRTLFRALPVINGIAAGKEKLASDDIIGYMQQTDEFEFEFEGQTFKAELLRGSRLTFLPEYDYVAMLVSGDSMNQAGIFPNNDYVILHKPKLVSLKPSVGDIVAVVFRDEADNRATLKRFYFDKSSDSVTLRPESSNPKHEPRVLQAKDFAGDNPPVAVVGVAIAVLKPQSVPKSQPEIEVQQRRFTDIRFPERCKINQPVRLSIRLTLKSVPGVLPLNEVVFDLTNGEIKDRQGELTVVVWSNSFEIDQRLRELSIPFDKNSERIEFELVAQKPGPHIVEIEFFHGADRVGYVKAFPK